MLMKSLVYAGLATVAFMGGPTGARACTLKPVQPGETAESRAAQEAADALRREEGVRTSQDALWDRADHVFIAKVLDPYSEQRDEWYARQDRALARKAARARALGHPLPLVALVPFQIPFSDLGAGRTAVRLEPITALKGALPGRTFEILDQEGWSSCGPLPQFDAFQAQMGDMVVVFVVGPCPSQDTVQDVIKPANIEAPRLAAELARAGF